ncbi:MAG: KilA-N domain-containing protein [Bacteroidales bacterium]|nr:KilA-N domain-containing protein [Bacteroidales bacterium]
MKTNQNLIRKMGDFDVIQRTSDGMFNATDLLSQWNNSKGQSKVIGHYFENSTTKEFINALLEEEMKDRKTDEISLSDLYVKRRGIFGGTWMTPLLFIDFAMWLNPSFKVKVLKFVYDELLRYRNEAGDAYKEMCSSVASILDKKQNTTMCISKVAKALNYIVYNQHETEIRNKQAEEGKVKELSELEKEISKLINRGFIKTHKQLIEYLRMLWSEKYLPKELN